MLLIISWSLIYKTINILRGNMQLKRTNPKVAIKSLQRYVSYLTLKAL